MEVGRKTRRDREGGKREATIGSGASHRSAWLASLVAAALTHGPLHANHGVQSSTTPLPLIQPRLSLSLPLRRQTLAGSGQSQSCSLKHLTLSDGTSVFTLCWLVACFAGDPTSTVGDSLQVQRAVDKSAPPKHRGIAWIREN